MSCDVCNTCSLGHEDPLDHRRRRGDVLRQLLARQRAGGRAPGARSRRDAASALHADRPPTRPTSAAIRCCLAGSASTCSSTSRCSGNTPRFLDRWWDSPRVISAFASRSISTDPKLLGDLTISMLEGRSRRAPEGVRQAARVARGRAGARRHQSAELAARSAWRGRSRDALKRPVCCTLQGEDLFLDGLIEPYRERAHRADSRQVPDVDRFIAVSEYYVPVMSQLLGIPADRMAVVPLGINLAGYDAPRIRRRRLSRRLFRADRAGEGAARARRRLRPVPAADGRVARAARGGRLPVARARAVSRGGPAQLDRAGLAGEFTYRGAVDRAGKLAFLRSLDVLSVPATYDEPKGVFLLEAMASGVPGRAAAARRVHRGRREDRRRSARRARRSRGAGRRLVPAVARSAACGTRSASAPSTASARTTASRTPPIG